MSVTLHPVEDESVGCRLVLPSGHVALIDEADRVLVEQYRWFARVTRHTVYVRGYRLGEPTDAFLHLHRVITGAPDGTDVDHRNHNGLDNRRANLRVTSHAENTRNARARSGGASEYKGVTWDAINGKWRAKIRINGRTVHLGRFADAWDAAQAYNAAAVEAWGEFAFQNRRSA